MQAMKNLVGIILALTIASAAGAVNEFKTWRIKGKDIERVELLPSVIASPGTMRIIFKPGKGKRMPLVIESDTGIDDCYAWASSAAGNPKMMLEITQWTTTETVNGVIVTSCFTIDT